MLPVALLVLAAATPGAAPMSDAKELTRRYETQRAENQAWLRESPSSYRAAILRVDFGDRKELTIGSGAEADVRIDDPAILPKHLRISVDDPQFTVTGLTPDARFRRAGAELATARLGPGAVQLGRYTLRLSHQGFPAVIVFDPQSPRLKAGPPLRYFPVDLRYRLLVPFTPDPKPETVTILSTRGHRRQAQKVGWFEFTLDGTKVRLGAVRLVEPGVADDAISLFFRDETSGKESYGVGRYLDPERQPDGRYLLDFNPTLTADRQPRHGFRQYFQ